MSLLDIGIIAIIVVSLIVGLFRGFLREVLSLVSWIVALWVAYTFARLGAGFLEPYIDQQELRIVASFAGIFILVLILTSLVSYLIHRLLAVSGITGVDRSLGGIFGAARGIVIISVLILAATFMDMTTQPWWNESMLVQYFEPVNAMLRSLIPENLQGYFQPKVS